MAYLTIEELKQKNVIDSIKNATEGENIKLQYLLDLCSSIIDSYVGFSFLLQENKVIYVDGDGRNILALPQRTINLISVKTLDGYTYNNSYMQIIGSKRNKVLNKYENFQDGVYNLEICGDFGWDEVPQDIIDCLVMLCNGKYNIVLDEDKQSFASGPFKRERIGDYEYELKSKINSITGQEIDTTGNSEVDLILSRYTSDTISIGVI